MDASDLYACEGLWAATTTERTQFGCLLQHHRKPSAGRLPNPGPRARGLRQVRRIPWVRYPDART